MFLQKAIVSVLPYKIEEEGYASRKGDAERFAAAAACQKLKVSLGGKWENPKWIHISTLSYGSVIVCSFFVHRKWV